MDALRRRPVVRESEVFAALFPRAFSPQQHQLQTKGGDALPTLHGASKKQDDARATEAAASAPPPAFRVPKLGALSPKTPRALMATLPMTASDCAVVWKFLCDWVTAQVAMEAPATIPGFGTVTMRTQALKIRMPFFDPDHAFLEKHGLRVESAPVALTTLPRTGSSSNLAAPRANSDGTRETSKIDVLSFNYMEMAACCGKHVEVARAKDWLQTVLQKLGEAMRQCERVEFDMGVGVVACANGVIENHMLPRYTSTPSTIPFEVRTGESVVKRSLMIPSSPNSSRTRSFLSGSNFSPGIRLHAAIDKTANDMSDLFSLHASSAARHKQKQPLRSLFPSSSSVGASPRTQRLKNGSSHAQQQDSDVNAMGAVAGYPALFDTISRTYCVEPDLNLSFLQPSSRIASNFAPLAASLITVKHAQRSGINRNDGPYLAFTKEALPCDPPYPDEPRIQNALELTTEDESPDGLRRRAASEERYFGYLNSSNRLMDVRWLAPLDQDLVDRIVASAVKYLSSAPSGHMKAVLDGARDEFVSNYHVSVKKAIMDYLLLRSATRERLAIPFGTPSHTSLPLRWQWGDNKSINGCMSDLKVLATASRARLGRSRPFSPLTKTGKRGTVGVGSSSHTKKRRRERVKLRLVSTFMLADPQIRALQYMWYDFEADLLLVKLPDPRELSGKMEPMDLHAFERAQLAHASQTQAYVMEHWYQRAKQMFEQTLARLMAGAFTHADVAKIKHMFNAVAVQMSLQIRSLVLKSIRAYAAFFEIFGRLDSEAPESDVSIDERHRAGKYSALLVSLSLQDDDVQFQTPLIEIPSMLVSVLHNLPQLFHNTNRVETQFQTSLEPLFIASGGGSHYSPFLWNVSSQETEIVSTASRIRQIIEQNLVQLHHLRAEYTPYGAAYRRISSVPTLDDSESMDEAFTSDKMDLWRSDLQSVRDVALSLFLMARSSRHLNLFSVDCQRVNSDLLEAFATWVRRQLSMFAEGTASFNSRLRQQYKDVAARLAKRPLDLYELVEAEEFVDLLKASKLHELQTKVEDVKQRMQFLLFHREEVQVDGPAIIRADTTHTKSQAFNVPSELLASTAKTIRWRTHIERLLQDAEAALVGERARIEAVFLAKRNRFQAEIEEFDAEVKSFSKKGDLRHAATYVVQLTKMKDALVGFKRQMESIVEEEAKLQWKPTDFGKLDDIAEEMEPYEQLWKTAREFRELNSRWLRTNIFELQAHEGLQSLQQMLSTISTVSNQLHLNSAAAAITAEMIKKQMSDFRENAKIVAAITNPSVQERHLKEISTLLALTIDPVEPVTLLKLLENGAFDHLARIVEISGNATMEKQIEEALKAIGLEWNGMHIQFKTEKAPSYADASYTAESTTETRQRTQADTPLSLSKSSVNDIKLLVEDHQLRLQTLQCLPHAVPFSHEISRWLLFLHDLYLVLDLMVANERLWKRIVPLFSAGIIDDEAEESTVFAQADAIHRSVCRRVENQPVCLELVHYDPSDFYHLKQMSVASNDSDGAAPRRHQVLLSDLRQCRELLERAGNNISVGFETRRALFPRYYLLSDSELVAALATRATKETDTPASSPQLWRYLRLCFPGIHHVQTSVQRELTAFVSAHGEQVPISSPIATFDVPLATWLAKLESSMATILQACTRAAVNDFARKEFRKWCLLWPEQVLLATILHMWTTQGEIHNKKSSPTEAALAWRAEVHTLTERVDAVSRELKAAATSSARFSLSNVVLLLHQLRDVSTRIADELSEYPQGELSLPEEEEEGTALSAPASTALSSGGPHETTAWLAQPRFYYDTGATLGIKFMSFPAIPYGFEYCGNASPPVYVVPLTLRCFHALALHAGALSRGSLVSGPAGVGKKTSCTALTRLCGRLMIQFDCTDRLHSPAPERFHALMDFLKGAVSCGAWLMMSAVENLQHAHFVSLLAAVCSQVMDCHAAKLTQCTVLGAKVRLKRGLHFIVMSPVSAGKCSRSTDKLGHLAQLRSAFHPVEVTAHDLGLITEFFLLESKLLHTKILAKLINAVLEVISREIELLGTEAAYSTTVLQVKLFNVRALQGITRHLAGLCVHERHALCSAYGWPPSSAPTAMSSSSATQLKPQASLDTEMPVELIRDIEKMETKATCVALREFAGSFLPTLSLESIDFVLRDFAANALGRELRVSRSFLVPGPLSKHPTSAGNAAAIEMALPPSTRTIDFKIEHAIQRVIQGSVATGEPSSDSFSQKVVHMYQALQNHRGVVVVGDIQSGKTAVWEALAGAVNQLSEESDSPVATEENQLSSNAAGVEAPTLRRTRTVVVYPRAVSFAQLFGSPSRTVTPSSDTLISHLIREAKTTLRSENTWLVFDGEINETWADRMLQLTEESDVDAGFERVSPANSRLPGLLLPSRGKRTSMPHGMRLLIETTTLKDVTPAFIAKVGVVHTTRTTAKAGGKPSSRADWRNLYSLWKRQHRATFAALHDELFGLLDTLMDETIDASLDFVVAEFGDPLHLRSVRDSPSLLRWRFSSFLALLYSLLIQSWAKLSTMVSGKQRKTAIHCYFLQALVWGIGHTSDSSERHKFHAFLRQWIITGPRSADSSLKRVLVLFFPSGTMGSATGGLSSASGTVRRLDLAGTVGSASAVNKETLYNFGFSVELGSKWMRWPEFYDVWLADQYQLGSESLPTGGGSAGRHSVQASVPESSAVSNQPPDSASWSSVSGNQGDRLFVRTPNMAAAVYLMHQLMAAGHPALLVGPQDAGKSTCGRVWLDLHAITSEILRNNAAAARGTHSVNEGLDEAPVQNEHVYSGSSVSASCILEQLETFIERKRVQQRRHTALEEQETSAEHASRGQDQRPAIDISTTTLVFVDDLQLAPTDQPSDNALELLRGILERNQIVHPTANMIMACGGRLAPFAALRHGRGRPLSQDLLRLTRRFVPIALPSPSDIDLSSICSAYVTSRTTDGLEDQAANTLSSDSIIFSSAAQETSQLVTTLVKATLKLFRVLSSDQWTFSSPHHLQMASLGNKNYAAYTAFQPSKAHYLFHTQDIFRVLQHVCCDGRHSLATAEKPLIAKLWCHESARVFGDRLSDDNDVQLFYNLLQDTVVSSFNLAPDGLLATTLQGDSATLSTGSSNPKNHAQVVWLRDQLHFSFIGESSGAGMVDGYREVHELQKVELSIERSMMAMYRANVTTESLSFVLCTHAIRHILRLTRVLRLNDDKHMVLIGRRGSKMETLTRLAAFICRKTTTSYCVPRGQRCSSGAWKTTLKTALLQCVRLPRDDRLVFILKDMWLDDLTMYAVLDRFFSGSKLLSDIISYDDFDESILQTLRDEANRERLGRSETPPSTAQDASSTAMHSKSSIVGFFFKLVRRKLQFVLIFSLAPVLHETYSADSSSTQRLAQLMWQYPFIQKACTIDYVFEWPEESLHTIAQKCFAASFATERDRLMQLSQVAVQLYRRTCASWHVWARGESLDDEENRRPATSGEAGRSGDKPVASARKPAASHRDRPCSLIQVEPSMLIEQISLFLAHLPRLQRDVEAGRAKYAAGLEFIERTEQILQLEQSQQQLLQPEMAKKTAATRRMSGNLEKEKLAATKVHHSLEMETDQVETQRVRLEQVEGEYEALVGESRGLFAEKTDKMRSFALAMAEKVEDGSRFLALMTSGGDETEHVESNSESQSATEDAQAQVSDDDDTNAERRKEAAVNRQRRAMIRTFTGILQPATSLRQLAECVGLIFDIEPTESRDELDPDEIVMDYWGSVTQRMQTEEFWQELVGFDVRKRMTESVVARTLLICTAPEFDTQLFTTIHELGVLLCEWVQACAIYARDTLLSEPKYAQLCQERHAFETAIAQMRARQLEMQTQASTTSNASAMRHVSEQERRELEGKLKDNSSTLQMATSVWKVLEPCKAKWRTLYEHFTHFGAQAMGDLMLATATMVYASSTTSHTRARLRALWSEELNKYFVVHSALDVPRPIHQLFSVDDRTLAKWQVDGLACQESVCLESGVLAMQSFLFPVVIDPHKVASEWLKRQLSDLANSDSTNEESTSVVVVSGQTTDRKTLWHTLTQCVKKKKPLLVEDFNEALAVDLLSVLQSKRRSRFDAVNQDLSSVASRGSASPGEATVGVMRRRSSMSIGLGISTSPKKGSVTGGRHGGGFGMFGNNRCWFEVPAIGQAKSLTSKTVIECGSDSCLAYFVYSDCESIPAWMAPLASCVSVIRFEFSPAQIRSKCVRTILDTHAVHSQALTEIHALRMDTIACDEQIETIENEILDFFSVEDPADVYGDTAKALKIVGNRSALHTLEGSKLESNKKIQHHYLRLACFSSLLKRSVDMVAAWCDMSAHSDSPAFPIEWIWKSLTHAITRPEPPSTENQVGLFTTSLRQCIRTAFADSNFPLLFDLLLSLRVNARRRMVPQNRLSDQTIVEGNYSEDDGIDVTGEWEAVLPRLVQLLECRDEAHVRTLCAGVSSKLLTARPSDVITVHKWRALCFLAEKLPSLKDLMTRHQQQPGGKDAWKDALALDELLAEGFAEWSPKTDIDMPARLCFVAALKKTILVQEIEAAVAQELGWVCRQAPALGSRPSTADGKSSLPVANSVTEPLSSSEALDDPEPHSTLMARTRPSPYTMRDLWKIYSSASAPILVSCRPETDFVREVSDVATQAKVTLDVSTHESLTSEGFEKSLLQSVQKGQWVVLPHFDSHPEWRDIVSRVLMTIQARDPHPDFRMWLSVLDPRRGVLVGSEITTMRLVKTNAVSFTDALRHTLSLLESYLPRFPSRPAPTKHAAGSGNASMNIGLFVRVAVLHALVSCRGLFIQAPWKMRGFEFGDDAVISVFQTLASTRNQRQQGDVSLQEYVRTLAVYTYTAGLHSLSERLLLLWCVDLVFGKDVSYDSLTMDAANRTIPEVAQVVRTLNELDASSASMLKEYEERIWGAVSSSGRRYHRIVLDQSVQGAVRSLRRVLESRGLLKPAPTKAAAAQATPSRGGGRSSTPPAASSSTQVLQMSALVMDTLSRFATDLEGYDLDENVVAEKFPREYKRPLNQLVRHEVERLRVVQSSLLIAIRYLQKVANASETSSPSAYADFACLMRGEAPPSWLRPLGLNGVGGEYSSELGGVGAIALEDFQLTILERLRFFQSWVELGMPNRLAIDKFQSSIECIFEVIHQHFVRNLVGDMNCDDARYCIRVMRIFEDKPQAQLPTRDEVLYLSGWRLFGHLQTEIVVAGGPASSMAPFDQRKRSAQTAPRTPQQTSCEIREEGTPVILEISTACLAPTHQAPIDSVSVSGSVRSLLMLGGNTNSNVSSRRSSIAPIQDYACPIYRIVRRDPSGIPGLSMDRQPGTTHSSFVPPNLSIAVPSALPIPQLAFSGSHLSVCSIMEPSSGSTDRI